MKKIKSILIIVLCIFCTNCSNTTSPNENITVETKTYGSGVPCGGSVMVFNNQVYRSYEGGIAPLDADLSINTSARIGNYAQNDVYHIEIINDKIWFALKNDNNPGIIKVINSNGIEINEFNAGINPGDIAYWSNNNISWTFIANEGTYDWSGPTNTGTITMIDSNGNSQETEPLGDIVHSLAVYENKLIVSVNNSQKILLFDISNEGINNKIEIQTEQNLSPREIIIIDNKAYFGAWDPDYTIYQEQSGFVQILNLNTLEIEENISVGIMPEGLLAYNNILWVANSGESTISRINLANNAVTNPIEVGQGPINLINYGGDIYISRTFYNEIWETFYGTSKIILD